MPDDLDAAPDPLRSEVDLPETLYHYTDINGLAGIWEKGQIWATNSLYLNDTTEVQLGLTVAATRLAKREAELLESINEVWARELDQRRAGKEVDGEVFNQERATFGPELTEVKEIRAAIEAIGDFSNSYIACLTEHGNQLSQWRGYAREGYCVGLDTKLLLGSLGDGLVMRRAHYYDEATNDAYAARMIDVAEGYRNWAINVPDVDDDFPNYVIGRFVMVEAAFMKDSSFCEESEVRIVEISSEPNLFTPHRYGMVPRRTIPIPPGAIRSVRVGPSAHEELKRQSLVHYFLHVGFGGNPLALSDEVGRPRVLRSPIPFRDW